MNLLITYISSHLLSIIEAELASNAPEIAAIAEKEVQLLISKLESYITKKAPAVASTVNPFITGFGSIGTTAINAAVTNIPESVKS